MINSIIGWTTVIGSWARIEGVMPKKKEHIGKWYNENNSIFDKKLEKVRKLWKEFIIMLVKDQVAKSYRESLRVIIILLTQWRIIK